MVTLYSSFKSESIVILKYFEISIIVSIEGCIFPAS
nr:MAG TPA: hypothetical protein [Caudoviricetes sp.]